MDEYSLLIILCLVGGGACAILVFVAWYFDRLRHNRSAKWQAIGLTPETSKWEEIKGWEKLAGVYYGRHFTVSHMPDNTYAQSPFFTRVQTRIRCPFGWRLTIKPKWYATVRLLDAIFRSRTPPIENTFSIRSDPPDLAKKALTLSKIQAILLSYPKPTIELQGKKLGFNRRGKFPDPEDAVAVFYALCDLARLIEQSPLLAGADY